MCQSLPWLCSAIPSAWDVLFLSANSSLALKPSSYMSSFITPFSTLTLYNVVTSAVTINSSNCHLCVYLLACNTSGTWLRWFLHCQVTIFPFPYSTLWKWVTKPSPHCSGEEKRLSTLSWREKWSAYILQNSSVRRTYLFSLLHSFIHLIFCWYQYRSYIYFITIQTTLFILLLEMSPLAPGSSFHIGSRVP